ncbi:MAG: hypothetical protein IIZ93_14895 [Acidaminococcaceae bacterium]|nr:hypothetical protein [Acidaminococcaceae bacterium]
MKFEKYATYDKKTLARVIGWHIMAMGIMENSTGDPWNSCDNEGTMYVFYEDIDKKFGTELRNDLDMVYGIIKTFDGEIIARAGIMMDGIDITFYTAYLPDTPDPEEA